ncbi:coiled-coil domain-containing protein 42 homolog isoform X1 [Polypterus senegalus]|uniref:coiled-coil domain-containing protein 42 homolog isoform X1 n=2 Tax=Polypterus senegalus TaxID=55291 RepID=UPI00196524DA|nr:coiled-coil domain-containing protein 42 homolog isoform X1 [Polypterus senegalus]
MALNLEDYFRTVYKEKMLVHMPEREDEHLTPVTRLLEKRREMAEVEQALAAQKEEFQMKMESLQQRREELERKEEQLKESLLKFDRFLKENDSKRSRALKKAQEEKEMARLKDRDIEELNKEIAVLTVKKENTHKKVEKNAIFWQYLQKVTEKSEKFEEIREILGRFDTLISTQEQLLVRESENQERIENERLWLHQFIEEKNNKILQYNNELATLQSRLDNARSEAIRWESKWNHIQNTAAKKTLLLGQIKMVTLNLFQLVNKQSVQQEDIPIEDTAGQLKKIQMFILNLTEVLADLKRMDVATSSHSLPHPN